MKNRIENVLKNWHEQKVNVDLYFHRDLDGVTSAIAMKKWLEKFDIEVEDAHVIDYASIDYDVPITSPNKKVVLDFANAKWWADLQIDHHIHEDKDSWNEDNHIFVESPSMLDFLNSCLDGKDKFQENEVEVVNIIDSGDYFSLNISPDEAASVLFRSDSSVSKEKNFQRLLLSINTLVLSCRNIPNFLSNIVKACEPSFESIYKCLTIYMKAVHRNKDSIANRHDKYLQNQKNNVVNYKSKNGIDSLENGQSFCYDEGENRNGTIYQFGGGNMRNGGYNRYTAFKIFPDAEWFCMGWDFGIVQLSSNPFREFVPFSVPRKTAKDVYDEIMKIYLPKLSKKYTTLYDIKDFFEKNITKRGLTNAVGFRSEDMKLFFRIFNIPKKLNTILDSYYAYEIKNNFQLYKELKDYKISLDKIISVMSGGHENIMTFSGLNFYGNPDKLIKSIMKAVYGFRNDMPF